MRLDQPRHSLAGLLRRVRIESASIKQLARLQRGRDETGFGAPRLEEVPALVGDDLVDEGHPREHPAGVLSDGTAMATVDPEDFAHIGIVVREELVRPAVLVVAHSPLPWERPK